MQNDFFNGGALAVPESELITPVINRIQDMFEMVIFTKDWHPASHKSFASNHHGKKVYDIIDLNGIIQILWPDHCIQNTFGAGIYRDIIVKENALFIHKGTDVEVDSYSGFFDNGRIHKTGLYDLLNAKNVTDTYICGLAADYCVKYTALDAVELGFCTHLIADATKAVNMNPGDYDKALTEMESAGVEIRFSHK